MSREAEAQYLYHGIEGDLYLIKYDLFAECWDVGAGLFNVIALSFVLPFVLEIFLESAKPSARYKPDIYRRWWLRENMDYFRLIDCWFHTIQLV